MMESAMDAALQHAQNRAQYLHSCSSTYIIQISLKELGLPSDREGFQFAKNTVRMLSENPLATLSNGIYIAAGALSGVQIGEKQVEQAIRSAINTAWKRRDEKIWACYFPVGKAGRSVCPSNREFLMAVADFVELWKGFCEEVEHERK